MTPTEHQEYTDWVEQVLFHPDISIEAFLHHLAAEAALEAANQKEITA